MRKGSFDKHIVYNIKILKHFTTYGNSVESVGCDFVCELNVDVCGHTRRRAVDIDAKIFVAEYTFTETHH